MRTLHYIFLVSFLCLWCSCVEDHEFVDTGYLQLSLDQDISVITKSNISLSEEPLSVEVKNEKGETVKKLNNFYAEAGNSRIALPSGNYTVQAYSYNKDVKNVGFEQAYYTSPVTSVVIAVGEVQTMKLTCTLTNVKVSVLYTEAIRKFFEKYQATVANDCGAVVFSETEQRAAYFAPNQLSVSLALTNNTGQDFMVKKDIPDTKPREYYKLRFDVVPSEDDEAGVDFDIVIEAMNPDTTFVLKLPLTDSSYGKEKPAFSGVKWPSINVGNPENKALKEVITSEVGLKSLILRLSDAVKEQLGLSSTSLELTNISTLDMAKLGLKLSSPVADSKKLELDFTEFSKNLASLSFSTTYSITLIAKDALDQIAQAEREIVMNPRGTYTLEPNAYARFAYLIGGEVLDASSSGYAFKFRKKDGSEFNDVVGDVIVNADKTFAIRINSLEPNTDYEYYVLTDGGIGEPVKFTTEMERGLPNAGFDDWYKKDDAWYPNTDIHENYWWDTANKAASMLNVSPTEKETAIVIRENAAKLSSKFIDKYGGVFAAGNIYSGEFGDIVGMSGATLKFGRPFDTRPSALEGYYKYLPGTIDQASTAFESKLGKEDQCNIYILLTDWDQPFIVNTTEGKFIDYENDPAIIAMGELSEEDKGKTNGTEVNGYKKFSIPLKYRNNRKPKYIVVVGAASRYGDYFTGSSSSVLYLDEFSLKYDDTIVIPNK